MTSTITQIVIALTGVTAIFLTQSRSAKVRKWACVLGLMAQPAWFYSSWIAEQWGIFAMCFFYTFAWAKGFYVHWIKDRRTDEGARRDPGDEQVLQEGSGSEGEDMNTETIFREARILAQVAVQRRKQDKKWGEQNHPSVLYGGHYRIPHESAAKIICQRRVEANCLTWADIAIEELAEAIDAPGEMSRREELVQLAAVVVAWIENIDRNSEQLAQEITDGL